MDPTTVHDDEKEVEREIQTKAWLLCACFLSKKITLLLFLYIGILSPTLCQKSHLDRNMSVPPVTKLEFRITNCNPVSRRSGTAA